MGPPSPLRNMYGFNKSLFQGFLEILPGVVWAVGEGEEGSFTFVDEAFDKDVAGFVFIEDCLEVAGEGGVLPAGPVEGFVFREAFADAFHADSGTEGQEVPVVTETEVGDAVAVRNGGVGLLDEVVHHRADLRDRHAAVAELRAVALAEEEVLGNQAGILFQVFDVEKIDQGLVLVERSADGGEVLETARTLRLPPWNTRLYFSYMRWAICRCSRAPQATVSPTRQSTKRKRFIIL